MRDAFDPLSAQSGRLSPGGDALQLADRVTQLSSVLHERLLGRPPAPAPAQPQTGPTAEQTHKLTPAEEAAEKVSAAGVLKQF